MALAHARLGLVIGRGPRLLARQTKAVAPLAFEGHRKLTTHPQYKPPFDYKNKGFPYWRTFIDWTTSRLNENSRIIQVEGPPCVGKAELAKKIADEFQLLYMPGINEDDIFIQNGFDKRELNGARSLGHMFYDLNDFYKDSDPNTQKMVGNLQVSFYRERFLQYLMALRHVLSTGQGVVLENSAWSDIIYADTLFRHKYMTKQAYKWYKEYRHVSLWEFWRPHLVIHLDADTKTIMDGMLKKNPEYAKSPVLTEDFIDTLRSNYKENYLPYMSDSSEVLSYDIADFPDFDIFALDLSKLELMEDDLDMPNKFKHWRRDKEEDYSNYRHTLFNDTYFKNVMRHNLPWEAPELMMEPEQILDFDYLCRQIPELNYSSKWYEENKGKFEPTTV